MLNEPASPKPERERGTPVRRYASLLWTYLRPVRGKAALMALLILVSIGLQLAVPHILRSFIDTAADGGALEVLLRTAALFLGVALANQLASAGATYAGADVGWTATNQVRNDLALHALRLDMAYHTSRTPGEMIERIDGDVTALSNFFSQFSVRVFGSALLLVGILVMLWLEDARVGAALTGFAVLVLALLNATREIAVPATKEEREANARLFGFIEERLAGIDDVRANGSGPHVMQLFTGVAREFFFRGRRAWMRRSSVWLLSYGMFTIGDLLVLGMGIWLFTTGQVTLGTAYLFFQYMLMLEAPIEQITQQMQELQKAGASIGRIDELLNERSDLPTGTAMLPSGPLRVSFERVRFAYDDHVVLDDVAFTLAPGRTLGLLGRTGSGKTTLTRLLFRLYEATSGTVRLGGVDLRDLAPDEISRRVGLVTQDVQLFHATVRDNLTFFDPNVSDERVLSTLAELELLPWLERLPNGLDTVLGAGGGGLSAGEAQLLAFARVFLKDPGVVVLDEPSSRLDPATEALLERATGRLLANRTAIVIAHRLGTVARLDEIMTMGGGRVLEHGERTRLERDPGSHYARMLAASRGAAHRDLDDLQDDLQDDSPSPVAGNARAAATSVAAAGRTRA